MIIYLIENLINHKIYIGQTIRVLNKRFSQHKSDSKKLNKRSFSYLHNAMSKYGCENFKIHHIDSASSMEELNKLEIWFIDFFQSTNKEIGYNIAYGGNGKGKYSDESRRKMSDSHKGEKNNNYGKHFSDEHKEKISQAQRGEKGHNYGKIPYNKNKPMTDAQKKKISESNKGKNHPNYGKKLSIETKQKISKSLKNWFEKKNYKMVIYE
jgi:group I intron endonuclease